MPVENSHQMFTRLDGAGVFVKRDSWSHGTVAKVISVGGLTSGPLPGLPLYPTAGSQKANCDGGNLLSRRACKDPRTHESRDLRLYRDRGTHLVARLKSNGAAEVRGPRLSSRLGDLRGSADTPTCSLISQRVAWGCREPQFWRLPWHLRRACVGSAPPRTTKY
jgi:hypothetical protein